VRGDALYVIAEGEVAVISETATTEHELGRLGEGTFFGEIALLTAQPRNATIRAVSPTRLLALDRAIVGRLCAGSPAVAKVLLRFVRERLLGSLMETNPLFRPFTADERFSLIERFEFVQFDEGTVILDEGKRAPGLFILLSGRAIGTIEGNPVYELGPGDIMGEVSLLSNGLAVATVRTQCRSLALELPRSEFQDLIMTHPQVLEYAASIAEERRKRVQAWREGKAIFHEGRLKMI
jgi:CRP-like cAMP-binding protein